MKTYQDTESIEKAYSIAKSQYAKLGVDTDAALAAVSKVPVSLHCWQGDDVTGFEGADGISGGGILATGNYPGRARNAAELRSDADLAFGRATTSPASKVPTEFRAGEFSPPATIPAAPAMPRNSARTPTSRFRSCREPSVSTCTCSMPKQPEKKWAGTS